MLKNKYSMLLAVLCLLMLVLVACSNDEDNLNGEGENTVSTVAKAEDTNGEVQEVKAKLAHFYSPDIFTYEGYELFSDLVSKKVMVKFKLQFSRNLVSYIMMQLYLTPFQVVKLS